MFKLVVLSVFVAVASAAPSVLHAPILEKTVHYAEEPIVTGYSSTILKPRLDLAPLATISKTIITQEPTVEVHQGLERVADVVQHVPTAVSHQSSTIVHSKANIVTPIVAPVTKTVITHQPVVHQTNTLIAQQPATIAIADTRAVAVESHRIEAAPLEHSVRIDAAIPLEHSVRLEQALPLEHSLRFEHAALPLHGQTTLISAPALEQRAILTHSALPLAAHHNIALTGQLVHGIEQPIAYASRVIQHY